PPSRPVGLIATRAVQQVEDGVLLVLGVARGRVDDHLALGADGLGVVLHHLHLAPLDLVAPDVEALRRRGELRRLRPCQGSRDEERERTHAAQSADWSSHDGDLAGREAGASPILTLWRSIYYTSGRRGGVPLMVRSPNSPETPSWTPVHQAGGRRAM